MIRLGLISCLGAALAAPGCIVTHDLGETADEGSTGSGEGSTGETDPDPSATSGQPGTTDPSDTATGQVPGTTDPSATATDGDAETETDGDTDGEPRCEVDPDYARWQFNGESFAPLEGVDASFSAILVGQCTVTETTTSDSEPVSTISLDCSLGGRIDQVVMDSWVLQPRIELTGTVPGNELVDPIYGTVRLKLALDWWGMGWNAWLVLETVEGEPLLDLVEAEHVDPTQAPFGVEVQEYLSTDDWHGDLQVSTATPDPACQVSVTECDDEASMFVIQWNGEGAPIQLPAGHEDVLPTPVPERSIRASATAAHTYPEPTCTDLPLASYALAAWTVGP